MKEKEINELAERIHAANRAVGWWDDPNRCLVECLQLISTEVAEATEAARKDLMDDHLTHRNGEEVELADAMIRLLDLGGSQGWDYMTQDFCHHSDFEGCSVGAVHFEINESLVELRRRLFVSGIVNIFYSEAIEVIIAVATRRGHALWAAVEEKLAYNAQRADHKRENRVLEGGKKW